MFIVYTPESSMGKRYDDPIILGLAIAEYLKQHPHAEIKIKKYI